MKMVVSPMTHVGYSRSRNEDRYYAGDRLWVVADGMGGLAGGDIASAIVVERAEQADRAGNLTHLWIFDWVADTNQAIVDYGDAHPEVKGLGSTVAGLAAIMIGGVEHWAIFHVGDSRVYRFYDNELERLTIDHTEAEELVAHGIVTREEAMAVPSRHVLVRSLGTGQTPIPDVRVRPRIPGETFLLCSDGLTGEVTDDVIGDVLATHQSPEMAVSELVRAALRHGGHDNVTAIVVHVDPTDSTDDLVIQATRGDTILRSGREPLA
jgi:protein phosphatase